MDSQKIQPASNSYVVANDIAVLCTCGPLQWREGEGDYVCLCRYIDIQGKEQLPDASRSRSNSPATHRDASYDSLPRPLSQQKTASIDWDGPVIPSQREDSEEPHSSPMAINARIALSRRSMRLLRRGGLSVRTTKCELERRLSEVLLWEGGQFTFCVNGQWLHYAKGVINFD